MAEERLIIKKDDFIEIEYTARTKEDRIIFDTTDEKTAKENDLHNPDIKYGPVVICVGEGNVIKGLDNQLIGKAANKSYTVEIAAQDAFGKKNAKYIQLINTAKFKKQNITPMPGMQVNVDDMVGTVKTVTGGRTLVDFNHPLASKDLVYDINIKGHVIDDSVKAKSLLKLMFGEKNVNADLADGALTIKTKVKIPPEVSAMLDEKIKKIIPGIKQIVYSN